MTEKMKKCINMYIFVYYSVQFPSQSKIFHPIEFRGIHEKAFLKAYTVLGGIHKVRTQFGEGVDQKRTGAYKDEGSSKASSTYAIRSLLYFFP